MAALTDKLNLNENDIFKLFREKLSTNEEERSIVTDVLEYRDGMLYLWLNEDQILLATNRQQNMELKAVIGFKDFQVLKPTVLPLSNITEIQLNPLGNQIAATSLQGVNIIHLPHRWGPESTFRGGEKMVAVKCTLLLCHEDNTTVLRTRWFPGSTLDPYLAVMGSNNRIWFMDTTSSTVLKCIKIEPETLKTPLFSSIGEFVDFDFASVVYEEELKEIRKCDIDFVQEKVSKWIWSIYLLQSSCVVYKIIVNLKPTNTSKCLILSSTLMFSQPDNIGSDARSMLVLNTSPRIVIISKSNGTIYHCLHVKELTTFSKQKEEEANELDITVNEDSVDLALKVFEIVEIRMGLNLDDELNYLYAQSVRLMRDPSSKSRYICTHDSGIHMIRMHAVELLEAYAATDENDEENNFSEVLEQTKSSIEYLLCTHINTLKADLPLKGVTIVDKPDTLVALTGNGEVVSMFISAMGLRDFTEFDEIESPTERCKIFGSFITNILKKGQIKNHPILIMSSEPTIQEVHNLIICATTLFRNNVLTSHKSTMDEIQSRVKLLRHMAENQIEDMKAINTRKTELQTLAENLAEKYEEINENQNKLTKKVEKLLLKSYSLVSSSGTERKIASNLSEKEETVKDLVKALANLRLKSDTVRNQSEIIMLQNQDRATFLNNRQSVLIRTILAKLNLEIRILIDRISKAKEELNDQD